MFKIFADKKIVLASNSPRRREILEMLDFNFIIRTPADSAEADNASFSRRAGESMRDFAIRYTRAQAEAKGRDVYSNSELSDTEIILAADTVVYLDEEIMGKPEDDEDSRRMLRFLSGKTHYVCTAVSLISNNRTSSFYDISSVKFNPLDEIQEKLIELYLASGSSEGKAGAYGIQDAGAAFVQSISGDFYNCMGLPVTKLIRELHEFI